MTKKNLPLLLVVAICFVSFFSCRKVTVSTSDATRNFFPLKMGKTVTYDVDSIYFIGANCSQVEVKSQMLYSVTDTFRDSKFRLSYIMDVFTRPYNGGIWQPSTVILITPTTDSLLYTQDGTQYIKLIFPIANGKSWLGNAYAQINNPAFAYLSGWNYTYKNYDLPYNNGLVNFNNSVTVLEQDQSINYPGVDSQIAATRTYAKEVYAYNVGMIYKEWRHTVYTPDTAACVQGYSVIMKAIDYN